VPGNPGAIFRAEPLGASLAALLPAFTAQLDSGGVLALVGIGHRLIGRGEVHDGLSPLI